MSLNYCYCVLCFTRNVRMRNVKYFSLPCRAQIVFAYIQHAKSREFKFFGFSSSISDIFLDRDSLNDLVFVESYRVKFNDSIFAMDLNDILIQESISSSSMIKIGIDLICRNIFILKSLSFHSYKTHSFILIKKKFHASQSYIHVQNFKNLLKRIINIQFVCKHLTINYLIM